jgi:rubrerythrin
MKSAIYGAIFVKEEPAMGAEQQQTELTDVVLCYQSLGIALDASPAVIEERFRTLSDQYKKRLAAPEQSVRDDAKASLELMGEMYLKIRKSVTYLAAEKEHEKRTARPAAGAKTRRVHSAVAAKSLLMNCPRCNGSVVKGSKVCPICKTQILTPAQRIRKTLLSPRMLVLYLVVLALAALAATRLLQTENTPPRLEPPHPQQAPRNPAKAPPTEPPR